MDDMAFVKATTRFRSEDQYLNIKHQRIDFHTLKPSSGSKLFF